MKKLNKKGMTLVELVIGLFVLGAAGTMLVSTFSAATNIINRATLFKNASSSASSTVELQEEQEPLGDYAVSMDNTSGDVQFDYSKLNKNEIEVTGEETLYGQFLFGISQKSSAHTDLRYKEFLPYDPETTTP